MGQVSTVSKPQVFEAGDVVFVSPEESGCRAQADGCLGVVLGFKNESTRAIYALDLDLQQNWLRQKQFCLGRRGREKGYNLECYHINQCYLRLATQEDY